MSFEPLCWFIHDSETARVVRRAVLAATIVCSCYLVAMAVAA